jgi:hypothetical protein
MKSGKPRKSAKKISKLKQTEQQNLKYKNSKLPLKSKSQTQKLKTPLEINSP